MSALRCGAIERWRQCPVAPPVPHPWRICLPRPSLSGKRITCAVALCPATHSYETDHEPAAVSRHHRDRRRGSLSQPFPGRPSQRRPAPARAANPLCSAASPSAPARPTTGPSSTSARTRPCSRPFTAANGSAATAPMWRTSSRPTPRPPARRTASPPTAAPAPSSPRWMPSASPPATKSSSPPTPLSPR